MITINKNNKSHRNLVRQYGRSVANDIIAAGFANTLAQAIKKGNLSRQQIADSIGCSKIAIDKWIYGENYPAVHYLWRLCVLLYTEDPNAAYLDLSYKINKEREF